MRSSIIAIAIVVLSPIYAVAIIGIARWIGSDHARSKLTMSRVLTISQILDAYHHRYHAYPRSGETSVARVPGLDVRPLPPRDGWGNEIRYMSSGHHYLLWSLGRDGKPQRLEGGGEFDGYDGDVVMYDSVYWQVPRNAL